MGEKLLAGGAPGLRLDEKQRGVCPAGAGWGEDAWGPVKVQPGSRSCLRGALGSNPTGRAPGGRGAEKTQHGHLGASCLALAVAGRSSWGRAWRSPCAGPEASPASLPSLCGAYAPSSPTRSGGWGLLLLLQLSRGASGCRGPGPQGAVTSHPLSAPF